MGLRSWENTCQGAGSLAVGAGRAEFKGLTGGHKLNQRPPPPPPDTRRTAGPESVETTREMLYKKDFFFSQKVTIYSTLHGAHPQTGPALETEEKNTLLQLY